MSKKNSREAKAARRADRAAKLTAEAALHSDRDVVYHFAVGMEQFPHDFATRYEVVYERNIFKHKHRWVLPRSASDAEKDALRAKLTEKYRRKPRVQATEQDSAA